MFTSLNKQQVKNAAAKTTSAVLGVTHFALDSMVDITMYAEQEIVHKLTGKDKYEIGLDRGKTTQQRKNVVILKFDSLTKGKANITTKAADFYTRTYGPFADLKNNQ